MCSTFSVIYYFRSCLSEYVRVDSGDRSVLLCHSNVTTPVQIGDTENSGHFDPITPITVTLHWSGYLDPNTQYLGRYEFAGEFLLSHSSHSFYSSHPSHPSHSCL